MSAQAFLPEFKLLLGGKEASRELMQTVIEFIIDDSLHLPDMFTIRLHDKDLEWVDSEELKVGTEVEISATAAEHGTQAGTTDELIKGEITALEPVFDRTGQPILLIRGYDKAHRLHRGKKNRSFLKSTDGEIVQKIARELNMQAEVDTTSVVYDYVFQDNQTNLEFLQTRAQRIGYETYVIDKTVHFRKRKAEQETVPELEWGKTLREFRPRLTTMSQVDEVIVRGWDPKSKKEIVSQVSDGKIKPKVGVSESGGELTKQAFGVAAQAVIVDRPVKNMDEANAMAQALSDEISGDFIQAEGVCFGDPNVQAGRTIKIEGVGTRFSGEYFVTSATHIYNDIGYETHFNISGRHPNTLLNLLDQDNGSGQGWGISIGLVTNNKDPEGWGRIKVKFPWLSESEESTWARMSMPMAGKDKGLYFLPEVNDEVLVAFEHGDIDHPYILGALWNGKDTPPKKNSEVVGRDGKVNQRMIRSRSGHEIILDDASGKEKIIIRDKSGKNQIEFDTSKNKITIESGGDLTIKGQNVTIEGSAKVDVKGKVINLN